MFRRLFSSKKATTPQNQASSSQNITTPQNQASGSQNITTAQAVPDSSNEASGGGPIVLPPFRPINDFIHNKEWSMPTFSDPKRLKHRVINNLIYYQRNYFILATVLMSLFGLPSLEEFFTGLLSGAICIVSIVFMILLVRQLDSISSGLNAEYIQTGILIAYGIIIHSIIYVVINFPTLVPIALILTHAMCRKRNFTNKIVNTIEKAKLVRTPMGIFLAIFNLHNQ